MFFETQGGSPVTDQFQASAFNLSSSPNGEIPFLTMKGSHCHTKIAAKP
jgi:hypothetical protein